MKAEDFDALLEAGVQRRATLHKRKRADYANEGDVLENFKRVSAAAAALSITVDTAIGYNVFMELMKLDRKWNLVKRRVTPTNESLVDTIDDQITYAALSEGILADTWQQGMVQSFNSVPVTELLDKYGLVQDLIHPLEQVEEAISPKVFVAAPWELRVFAHNMMVQLAAHNVNVVYDWTAHHVDMAASDAAKQLAFLARRDMDAVKRADYLLVLHDGRYSCRGTWAEVGMALALGIPIAIWTTTPVHQDCIYGSLPEITNLYGMDALLHWLGVRFSTSEDLGGDAA